MWVQFPPRAHKEECKSGLFGRSRKPSESQDSQRFESSLLRMRFEFSAGGVVYKKEGNKTFILAAQHSQHHGWVFPKGLIGDYKKDESKKDTATREVKEETGIDAKIIKQLTPVTYWYFFKSEKIKKTVYYFLMEYLSGDISKHDKEMENVEWIKASKVDKKLTYSSDKKVWQSAQKLIK